MTLEKFLSEWNNGSDRMLVHTSGSTGKPKPMLVEKKRMLNSARITCDFLGLKPGDSALLCMSLDYIAGKMVVVRSIERHLHLISVYPSGHPLKDVNEEITFAAMVPMQVYNTLQVPEERARLCRISHLIIGGGAIDEALEQKLKALPGDIAIWSTYGMTETLSHIALRRINGAEASEWYQPFDSVKISQTDEGCLVIDAPQVCAEPLVTNDIVEIESYIYNKVEKLRFRIKGRKDNVTLSGRAVILDRSGHIVTNIYAGGQGSELMKGALLRSGSLILSGMEPKGGNSRQGILLKVDKSGRVIYQYKNAGSGYCDQFEVLGNTTEYICAAFSGDKEKEQTTVVRLDDKGKPYYVTVIPAKRFIVTGMNANINDGSVIVTGNSSTDGGIIYKIRPEGDIVFAKTLIPANQGSVMLNQLQVARNGNILVGGSGSKGYYALLRNDGTALYSGTSNGGVRGVGMNRTTGESVVTTYDVNARRGTFVRILPTGKAEFDRTIDGNFDKVKVTNNGEVLLLSSDEGRVCMYSATGEKEFDRYVTDNKPTVYRQALTASSGELLFLGSGSRLVKLGHGLYVSDVKITKPVNGTATAVFTVTLTGYATTKEGAPVPVSVGYATREASATTANNFTPVKGKLSFTPSRGTADRYLVKQDIEVPVKANDLIEGVKEACRESGYRRSAGSCEVGTYRAWRRGIQRYFI